jgi:hypothetical protein
MPLQLSLKKSLLGLSTIEQIEENCSLEWAGVKKSATAPNQTL